jgi:hypothetical protein
VKQRGATKTPSRFIAFRATAEDQSNIAAILADDLSGAIRCGLERAAKTAKRLLKGKR